MWHLANVAIKLLLVKSMIFFEEDTSEQWFLKLCGLPILCNLRFENENLKQNVSQMLKNTLGPQFDFI